MSLHDYIAPHLQITVADKVLKEVFLITKYVGLKAFLVFGTCLGFVRDKRYIKGNHALDIGVICEWKEKDVLKNALKMNSFILKKSKPHSGHIVYGKKKVLIDLWFYTESEKFYSKFDYVTYKRKKYPVPHPVEKYLSACYSNWEIKENQKT
jgi:hypothetical protein